MKKISQPLLQAPSLTSRNSCMTFASVRPAALARLGVGALCLFLLNPATAQDHTSPPLVFDLANVTAAGSSCSANNVKFKANGRNEVAVFMPTLKASLLQDSENLTDRATCQFFLPIKVTNEQRIKTIRIYSGLQISKSRQASVSSSFLAYLGTASGVDAQTLNIPSGAWELNLVRDWHTTFHVPPRASCQGESEFYTENLRFVSAISALRESQSEFVSAALSKVGAIYFVFDTEKCNN